MNDHWVIKLGGSLMRSPLLPQWLEVLAEHGRGRAVIVPGGGCFADAVREAHSQCDFDERSAHRLALFAMAQYGHLLMSLQPRLQPVLTLTDVQAALASDQVPVWLPLALLNDETEVPANWDWSSDSLALWLAQKLAVSLCLVKSVTPDTSEYDALSLQQTEFIDRAFVQQLRQQPLPVYWLGEAQCSQLQHGLATGGMTGALDGGIIRLYGETAAPAG